MGTIVVLHKGIARHHVGRAARRLACRGDLTEMTAENRSSDFVKTYFPNTILDPIGTSGYNLSVSDFPMPNPVTRGAWKIFLLLDRLGVHILPKQYYTPVPDYHWLRQHPEAWMGRAPLIGVGWDLDQQVDWLAHICRPY